MAIQQERAELHKTIWKIANDLRGSVDGWEFKAYVLGSIFYRFISENICDYIHQLMTDADTSGMSLTVDTTWADTIDYNPDGATFNIPDSVPVGDAGNAA